MKIKQSLFLVFMVLISLCIISAASAADNATDIAEISNADEVQSIDNVDESVDVLEADENDEVLKENIGAVDEATLSADESAADSTLGANSTFGIGGDSTKFDFSNITFDFGNGTKIDLGSLLNGTTISFGNGTSFNITDLLNSNMTFGNNTSFNLTQLMNMTGNGTGSFNISAILDMLGGKTTKITFDAKDISQVYSGPITFTVKVLENDEPVAQQTVIFTVDNVDYVGRTDENGTATVKVNLAAGTHYIYIEYNNVIGKNKVEITKAASKITAKKKTFKAKAKTKKYAITLKDNKGKAIKKAKVTLKIKSKTFSATTNAKGKAIFKIKLTKKAKYTAKIKFAGNGYYKASSAKKQIILK